MSSRKPETLEQFRATRALSRKLAAPLSDADATVQSMPDASPAKWHLAHTSWFFEAMVLSPSAADYEPFDPAYGFLFNSYYEVLGARHPRPRRGMLTRPTLETVHAYRDHVDRAVEDFFRREPSEAMQALVELGCHHESQHQELLLTDILHLFAQNPLRPAYKERATEDTGDNAPLRFLPVGGGLAEIGAGAENFAYDCERPRHRLLVPPCRLADRLTANAEWIEFIGDGGYRNPLLWLSDGWAKCLSEDWTAPLYWEQRDGAFWTMTLSGMRCVDPAAPVTHVSYFEADAFARWSGKRLPTEAEWELAAAEQALAGNFLDSGRLRPAAAERPSRRPLSRAPQGEGPRQMFGDVWEWTSSPFSPYPRFRPTEGAASEYNGKFMCGQFVLRGGSCASPKAHIRATYRNFFPPDARWQFSGVRLAEDS